MMDGALVPLDRAYEAITTPANRRKITSSSGRRPTPRRSRTPATSARTSSPRWGRTARTPCSPSCKASSRAGRPRWRGYKALADTGNYPGKDEIADGLLAIKKLLG